MTGGEVLYNPFPPNARVGAIGAHPDDIEFLLGHLIARAADLEASGDIELAAGLVLSQGKESKKGPPEVVETGGREAEARAGLGQEAIGLQKDHIWVRDLPDGRLAENSEDVEHTITDFVDAFGLTHVVGMGWEGGDRLHDDHIESFFATVRAVGDRVTIFSLNADEKGELEITGNPKRKLGGVALHRSQWPLRVISEDQSIPEGWVVSHGFAIPPTHTDDFAYYTQYLVKETYDVYPPGKALDEMNARYAILT